MTASEGSAREGPKPASASVARQNAAVLGELPFGDAQDFEDARRGFLGTIEDAHIVGDTGRVVWTMRNYDFQRDEAAPPTVNPSLWRQARLNTIHGLFEVVPGVYQVRGFDIANMTLIEGRAGVIVVDTLTGVETARAALALYRQHRGDRPVTGVIYTHTHVDHWGGAAGVVDAKDVAAGRIPLLAPYQFTEHTVSENVIAGNAMLRRALYQFGALLPRGPAQQVDCGLGKSISAGRVSLVLPNDTITRTGETRTIDGVEFVFQMAPETEAPAEMHFYLPAFKTLNLAENATHNFHNLLPFRGAQVRSSLDWSKYIQEAIDLWGDEAEALCGQHHWPTWGCDRVVGHLEAQRDLYRYAHDQTVRLMNHGLKSAEIAEQIGTPKSLDGAWATRGYYGHIRHNSKAIYQHYLGWYDANPANLDPLPPVETGRKMVEYMGGAEAILRRARADFAKGEFRFVAQVLSQLVFADADNPEARALLADTFEQLGYLCESATWRNAYLFGALEFRHGMPNVPSRSAIGPHILAALPTDQLFDYIAVRLNGPKAEGFRATQNWHFTDTGEKFCVIVSNSAMSTSPRRQSRTPDATVTLTRKDLDAVIAEKLTFEGAIAAGSIQVSGDSATVLELFSLLDTFERMFEIVEPRRKGIT
jgi:alkyl sulfatase BDS1-like metallo-beta-lactamase superfamily hydrolase